MDNPGYLASRRPAGGSGRLSGRGDGLSRGLAALLLCCLLCAICCSCNRLEQKQTDTEAGAANGAVDSGAEHKETNAAQASAPANPGEIQTLWDSFSLEEQETLIANGLGKTELLRNPDGQELAGLQLDTGRLLQAARPFALHAAGRPLGDDLGWRKLLSWQRPDEGRALIAAGNLDEDPQTELFLSLDPCRILELDGAVRELPAERFTNYVLEGSWDYDGNGQLDLLGKVILGERERESGVEYHSVVLGLDGSEFGRFEDAYFMNGDRTADLNGDGAPELLLWFHGKGQGGGALLMGMQTDGQVLWSASGARGTAYDTAGDIDGDGRDELIGFGYVSAEGEDYIRGRGRLMAIGPQFPEQELGVVTVPFETSAVPFCFDVNADGCDDLLLGNYMFDTRTGKSIELQVPAGWPELYIRRFAGHAVLQYTGQNCLAFLATSNHLEQRSNTLLIWGQGGKLLHQEHFGEELLQLILLPGDQAGRLVLSGSSGIIISEEIK